MATSRRLAANVVVGITANVVRFVVQIIMLPLMARLLGPAELGVFALALPIMTFVLLLTDAGLGDSLAKERSGSTIVWSSAFWSLIGAAVILAAVVYGSSFVVADVAEQPKLPEVMLPLSLTLIMFAASVIPISRMLRDGDTTTASMADIASNLVGAAVGIGMAFAGAHVWAMVGQYVAVYFVRMLYVNFARPFLPRLEFSAKSLLSHMGMGGQILGGRLLELGTRMLENSKVSRNLGAAALGNYSYAFQIGTVVTGVVTNPLWANVYYIAINKPIEELRDHFIHSQRTLALLTFPASILLALGMPTLVPMFLGPAWTDSIFPIMILVLTGPIGALGSLLGAVLFARDKGHYVLIFTALLCVFRVIWVFVAWPYGVFVLSIGVAIPNILWFVFAVVLVKPITGMTRRHMLRSLVGPTLAGAGCAIAFYLLVGSSMTTLIWLCEAGLIAAIAYALVLLVVDQRRIRSDLASVTTILRRRPS